MKRDMDLVRAILLAVEKHERGFAPGGLQIERYTAEQVAYHAYIMDEAGLVVAADTTHMGSAGPEAAIVRLTWAGHDFLDAARPQDRWEKAKALVAKVGGASFQILVSVLTDLARQAVGL